MGPKTHRFVLIAVIMPLLVSGCAHAQDEPANRNQADFMATGSADQITGAWELIMIERVYTKPRPKYLIRAVPEYKGQWHFLDGRFSQIVEKTAREPEYDGFQFEAFGGEYTLADGRLHLRVNLSPSLLPFLHRPHTYQVKLAGDELRLTGAFVPIVEDMSEGTQTILLRRVRSSLP